MIKYVENLESKHLYKKSTEYKRMLNSALKGMYCKRCPNQETTIELFSDDKKHVAWKIHACCDSFKEMILMKT